MRACCKCSCSRGIAGAATSCVLAIIVGLCYKARFEVQQPCQPLPTSEALAALGISLFERPSDGGNLEWFQYGAKDDPNAVVWLFVHGALNTGGVLEIFPDFDRRMRELNVRVIAPTMPGWGSSSGYGPLFGITNHVWLQRWRRDALALLDSLHIEKFWVSGMSLGGTPASALAEIAQSKNRLLGFAPLISSMWSHPGFDPMEVANYALFDRFALSALVNPYVGSLAAQLLRFAILASSEESFATSPMVPPGVIWNRVAWGLDMQRAVRYQLVGQVQSNRLVAIASPTDDPLINWSIFIEDVPVYIFYGEADTTVRPVIATFTATKLPWAKLMPFTGGHLELDIFAVANALFTSSNQTRP